MFQDGVHGYLQSPENVTFPNAANTSITVQWQYPATDDCNTTNANLSFEIKYWLVNEMESAVFVNVSGTSFLSEDDNQTYIRHDFEDLEPRQYYSFQVSLNHINSPQNQNDLANLLLKSSMQCLPCSRIISFTNTKDQSTFLFSVIQTTLLIIDF